MAITSALRRTDWFGSDYDLSKRSHLMTDEAVPVYDDEPLPPSSMYSPP